MQAWLGKSLIWLGWPGFFVGFALTGVSTPLTAAPNSGSSPVAVAEVKMMDAQARIELTGTVIARRSSKLSTELDGLVEAVLVEEGDFVSEGQPLLRLRAKPKALELEAQKASLLRARAVTDLARLKESRQADLLKSKVAAKDTYDIAAAELRQASADVANSQARTSLLQDQLERLQLLAPFHGVIGHKGTEVGSWLRSGEVAFSLEEIGVVRVVFSLPQRYYSAVNEGTEVLITFDAWPGEPRQTKVSRKIDVGNSGARTFPVWVDFENSDHRIVPGMSARGLVDIGGSSDQQVVTVAQDALIKKPDGTELIWVIIDTGEGAQAQPLQVNTGRSFGDQVEVVKGALKAGDRIVVRGNENLQPGQQVQILN